MDVASADIENTAALLALSCEQRRLAFCREIQGFSRIYCFVNESLECGARCTAIPGALSDMVSIRTVM